MSGLRRVPPTGFQERGTMGMPTMEFGVEPELRMTQVNAPNLDLNRSPIFKQVWSTQVHHYTGGRLYVAVASLPLPAGVLALFAEIRIIGTITGIRDVLKAGAVNSFSGPMSFDLSGYATSFTELAVEGREVVNGLPSGLDVPTLKASVSGRLFR